MTMNSFFPMMNDGPTIMYQDPLMEEIINRVIKFMKVNGYGYDERSIIDLVYDLMVAIISGDFGIIDDLVEVRTEDENHMLAWIVDVLTEFQIKVLNTLNIHNNVCAVYPVGFNGTFVVEFYNHS